jgi:hypothetical protein
MSFVDIRERGHSQRKDEEKDVVASSIEVTQLKCQFTFPLFFQLFAKDL